MDLEAMARAKGGGWERLGELARRRGAMSGRESDELIARYQSGAADLSALRTVYGSSKEADLLSVRLSGARLRLTGTGQGLLLAVGRFFARQLPASLYRIRWWTLGAAAFAALASFMTYLWISNDPAILQFFGSEAQLEQYAEKDFIDYYSEYSESSFAARVFTNNAWIAAQCILLGITGVAVPYVLLQNATGLGMSAALLGHYGHLDAFFLWIAPHGMLELTMVFVAAAAGMRLFWSWVAPGARRRIDALAEEGRSLIIVAVGTTIFLFISGLIEGYVTRQDWPWAVKIGIGALAFALYCAYAFWLGRRAARAGETGDLVEFESGARTLIAA